MRKIAKNDRLLNRHYRVSRPPRPRVYGGRVKSNGSPSPMPVERVRAVSALTDSTLLNLIHYDAEAQRAMQCSLDARLAGDHDTAGDELADALQWDEAYRALLDSVTLH